MKKHKIENLKRFAQLDGITNIKDTDPELFSYNGVSTDTFEVENDEEYIVTMEDCLRAINMYLDGKMSYFDFQQWGEWMVMGEFFDVQRIDEDDDEVAIIINDIDSMDTCEESNPVVKEILYSDLERAKKYIEKYHSN